MRKMNKIVALSLVLAMALSMMASAVSFKDQATINEDLLDEINLLVNLGVYAEEGTGAGYFEPGMTITRAQAAKMIYVLKNKGVDNKAVSWTGLDIFTDVEEGSWLEGYVNYCASTGIMVGGGDGKFNPNDELTGVQLAKMLLVVIGYKADVEGYTGDKWDANILADAEEAGFFVDYELPVNGKVTREWAALMIANAINATKVRYADGELVEMYNDDNEPITYAAQDLGLKTYVGNAVATPNIKLVTTGSAANNTNGKNKNSAVGTTSATVLSGTSKLIEFDMNPELLGQKVEVLYKGTDLDNATKIYGVTAHKDVVALDTTIDAVSYDADEFNDTLTTYEDFVRGSIAKTADGIKNFFARNDGREIKLIDNDGNGTWDVAVFASAKYDKVNYINPANHTIRFANHTAFDISGGTETTREEAWEKVNFVDSLSKNDIVKITKDFSTGEDITVLELVDVVAGTLTKLTSGGVATIDGGTYEASTEKVTSSPAWALEVKSTARNYFVDGKYVVYTDSISSGDEVPTNLALLINAAKVAKEDAFGNLISPAEYNNKVQVVLNDGTKAVYTYDASITTGALAWADIHDGSAIKSAVDETIFEYVMKDSKIALKDLGTHDASVVPTSQFVKKDMEVTNNTTTTYRTNEDTYFFVVDGSKHSVVKASELKTGGNVCSTNIVLLEDGFNYVVAAAISATVSGDNTPYITATAYTEEYSAADEANVFYFDVTDFNGNVETLKLAAAPTDTYKNKIVTYTVDDDGFATLSVQGWSAIKTDAADTLDATTKGAITYFDDKAALISGTEYKFADDMVIYYVDTFVSSGKARMSVSEGDGLVLAAEVNENTFEKNAVYALNGDNEITVIVVEVNGETIWSPPNFYTTTITPETVVVS